MQRVVPSVFVVGGNDPLHTLPATVHAQTGVVGRYAGYGQAYVRLAAVRLAARSSFFPAGASLVLPVRFRRHCSSTFITCMGFTP